MTPYHSSLCPTFRCKTDVDALKTAYNTLHQTQEMLNHTSAKLTSVMDSHDRSGRKLIPQSFKMTAKHLLSSKFQAIFRSLPSLP